MKIGFNGLNRCFDFGLIGPFRPKRSQADPSNLSRPLQTQADLLDPLGPELALLGLSGGCGGWEALPYKGGLPQGALVAQNLVDEGGYVA